MITHIAESNDKLYDALFADITKTVGITVRNLEEYFLNLRPIAQYVIEGTMVDGVKTPHPEKTYFLRLPVDENVVTIDANTRNITLSSAYRSNGIAVVGDTYAETLWFQIDRYYDLQDLSLLNIYIYWELPNKVKGYSIPVFKDIHSEAGKLIFSWTIPDILTETAGNIKFYVSFQDGETYVFNTLAQTAKINATLDANSESDNLQIDGVSSDAVLQRLRSTTNIGSIVVNRPLISDCTFSSDVELLTDTQPIEVYAYSMDLSAELTYKLYKDGNLVKDSNNNPVVGEECYAITKDTTAVTNKVYYNEEEEECAFYQGCYEKGVRFTVSEAGSYQCKIEATIAVGEASNTSAPAYTTRWLWEKPTNFTVPSTAVKFKNNANNILFDTTDIDGETSRTLVITWPIDTKESPQQQAATYEAKFSFGGTLLTNTCTRASAEEANTEFEISYPFGDDEVAATEMSVRFTKTLNKKTQLADSADIVMRVQSEAKPYMVASNATVIDGSLGNDGIPLFQAGTSVGVELKTASMLDNQKYSYCWQIKNGSNWNDATSLVELTVPVDKTTNITLSDSFKNKGEYRLKVVAKFGADTKITYSSETTALIKVYTV